VLVLERFRGLGITPQVYQVFGRKGNRDRHAVRQTLERVLDDFGRRLAELRRARRWTQSQAADAAGMPEKDYQAIENGRRAITIRTALALAQALDVPLRVLFDPPTSKEARRPGRPAGTVDRDHAIPQPVAAEQSATSGKHPVARSRRVHDANAPKRKTSRK
jgi:transcriptional regulator with XRE-family HTH domain